MTERKKMIRLTDEEYDALRLVVYERKRHVDGWVQLAQDRSGLIKAEEAAARVQMAVEVLDRVEGLI